MPLSRTRSLLSNINVSSGEGVTSAYLPTIQDTNGQGSVLPPLKSKLNGSATLHHNSSASSYHNGNMINGGTSNGTENGSSNGDNMSIKLGSLVSNGSISNGINGANGSGNVNTPTSNGHHSNGHSLSGLPSATHMNGVNTLP